MIKKIIRYTLGKFGFTLRRNENKVLIDPRGTSSFNGYDYGSESQHVIEITKEFSMMPYVNIHTLYEQAIYCEKNNIQGAFVECGVWKGGAVGAMAMANLKYGKSTRDLHLFDSFDDICAPDSEKDGEKAIQDVFKYSDESSDTIFDGKLEPIKGMYDSFGGHGTINECSHLLIDKIKYPKENIFFHKGWFQNTLPTSAEGIDKIAILRLDGDWYDSIKICLDYLYDKVAENGVIIIDDYGYYEGCTNAVDDFFKEKNIVTFLSYSSVGCRYFIKK